MLLKLLVVQTISVFATNPKALFTFPNLSETKLLEPTIVPLLLLVV